jgi:hypothetical protein
MRDRALPAHIIDVIRDGLPASVLRRSGCGGDCAVFRALVSTAASAQQRGWDRWEWEALFDEARSQLGRLARIERGRELSQRRYQRRLVAAWESAERWLDDRPEAWTPEDVAERIEDVRQFVADAPLTEDERAMLTCACDLAAKHGTDSPTLPWRTVAATTGLGPSQARRMLAHLCEEGLLTLVRPGYAGRVRRKANVYQLPTPEAATSYLYRGTRSMDGVCRSMDAPEIKIMDGVKVYGRDHARTQDKEENMATEVVLTVRGATLDDVLTALAERGIAVSTEPVRLPENVVPIKRKDREKP